MLKTVTIKFKPNIDDQICDKIIILAKIILVKRKLKKKINTDYQFTVESLAAIANSTFAMPPWEHKNHVAMHKCDRILENQLSRHI